MMKRYRKLNKNLSERTIQRPHYLKPKASSKESLNTRSIKASPESIYMKLPTAKKKVMSIFSKKAKAVPSLITRHRKNGSESERNLKKLAHNRTNSYENLISSDESELLAYFISQYFLTHRTEPRTSLDFYKIGKIIGKGAFGKVLSGTHKLTGLTVAIKAINKTYLESEKNQQKVRQEIAIHKSIQSRYIVKILEVFESPKHLLIVLEYMGGGDMFKYIKIRGRLSENEARPLFEQVLTGANKLHSSGILHRDFKLDNILLNSNYNSIKICDFGVSVCAKKGKVLRDQCGTPAYLAPEIIADRGYEGFSVDVWSLGVVFYIIVCGTIPFKGNSLNELHKSILKGVFEVPEFLSQEAKDLIIKMLRLIPSNRITVDDALGHPWFLGLNTAGDHSSGKKIDDFVVNRVEKYGFPKEFVVKSLQEEELNHATATYHILNKDSH